jgi:hypothetical protein
MAEFFPGIVFDSQHGVDVTAESQRPETLLNFSSYA